MVLGLTSVCAAALVLATALAATFALCLICLRMRRQAGWRMAEIERLLVRQAELQVSLARPSASPQQGPPPFPP